MTGARARNSTARSLRISGGAVPTAERADDQAGAAGLLSAPVGKRVHVQKDAHAKCKATSSPNPAYERTRDSRMRARRSRSEQVTVVGAGPAGLACAITLAQGGRAVASCMFTGFKRQSEHVEQTIAFFREHAGLEMRNPRPFGGFANFRLPRAAMQDGRPVVGEQAGFQDALAGFGMRYALRSGLLAARSILDRTDYTALWRRALLPLLRAGIVNRFIFNSIGPRGRAVVLRRLSRGDAGVILRRLYQPSVLSRIVFPIARLRYRAQLRDSSCDHANCHCVWCQCQKELAEIHGSPIGERQSVAPRRANEHRLE